MVSDEISIFFLLDLLLSLRGLGSRSRGRGARDGTVSKDDDLKGDDEVEGETEDGRDEDDIVVDLLEGGEDSSGGTSGRQEEGDDRELSSGAMLEVREDLRDLGCDKDANTGGLKNRHNISRNVSRDHGTERSNPKSESRDAHDTDLLRIVEHKGKNDGRLGEKEKVLSPGREGVLARDIVAQSDGETDELEDEHGEGDTSSRLGADDGKDLGQLDSHRTKNHQISQRLRQQELQTLRIFTHEAAKNGLVSLSRSTIRIQRL